MGVEPRDPGSGVGEVQHAEPQRGAGQRPAHRGDGHARAVGTGGELGLHVVDHAAVGRGRRGEHRCARGQLGEQVADAPVVGTEVVAPVGDAVRLVDHEQAAALDQAGQHLVAEPRVGEALGGDQQQVDLAGAHAAGHLAPLGRVGRADLLGDHAGAGGCGDLVAHQGQQRRHQQGRARARGAQQRGGDEVDGRLAPAGALHDQGALAARHQGLDGLPLAVAEGGVVAGGEGAQDLVGTRTQVGRGRQGGGHGTTLEGGPDRDRPLLVPDATSRAVLALNECRFASSVLLLAPN